MKKIHLAVFISIVMFLFCTSNINIYAGEEKNVTITINKVKYVFYEDSLDYYPGSNQVDNGILAKDVTVDLGGIKLTFPAGNVISFYDNGEVKEGYIEKDTIINEIKYRSEKYLTFYDSQMIMHEDGSTEQMYKSGTVKGGS